MEVRTTELYVADADLQNILEPATSGAYLCSDTISIYYIFSRLLIFQSARDITWMIQNDWINQERYDLDRATLKHGKTHFGRGLITDPIAHVTDVDADLE